MDRNERRYAWVRGDLREVRPCWVWLFRLLRIGFDLPEEAQAFVEVLRAMETYHRKCQVYFRSCEV